MADAFARVIVAARFPIIVGWIAAAVVMANALPTLREAQTGALGQLVPADSRALEAEKLSASTLIRTRGWTRRGATRRRWKRRLGASSGSPARFRRAPSRQI